jgi:hypothetical protein
MFGGKYSIVPTAVVWLRIRIGRFKNKSGMVVSLEIFFRGIHV